MFHKTQNDFVQGLNPVLLKTKWNISTEYAKNVTDNIFNL